MSFSLSTIGTKKGVIAEVSKQLPADKPHHEVADFIVDTLKNAHDKVGMVKVIANGHHWASEEQCGGNVTINLEWGNSFLQDPAPEPESIIE